MVLSPKEKENLKIKVMEMPYAGLQQRQSLVQQRLTEISIDDPFASVRTKKRKGTPTPIPTPNKSQGIPYDPKKDSHWDFVMKEMQWLSVDFQGERKRQTSLAKKQAGSIKLYHSTKEKRRIRAFAEMEHKKRRLASKLARDVVKGWWHTKIERVIAYKQKVDADLIRKRGMDRHLVNLVKQTERYTDLLNEQLLNDNAGVDGNGAAIPLTIEQALNETDAMMQARTARMRHTDYQMLADELRKRQEIEFYGESTEDEGESEMEDYLPNSNGGSEDQDDETTLIEAEEIDATGGIMQVQKEARLLLEESQMDIEDVLKRFEGERDALLNIKSDEHQMDADDGANVDTSTDTCVNTSTDDIIPPRSQRGRRKRVKFASNVNTENMTNLLSTSDVEPVVNDNDGNDADDDADMSDVDDFASQTSNQSDGSDEFVADQLSCVDDETTLDAEMRLKPEMHPDDEISLLQKEAEMSVEELRAVYLSAQATETDNGSDNDNGSGVGETENIQSNNDNFDDTSMASASSGSEDFEDEGLAVDDETTLEAEERLEREMSAEDEIALLQRENEMSVEELRAMYLSAQATETDNGSDNDNGSGVGETENIQSNNDNFDDTSMASASSGSEDFEDEGLAVDDETTLEAEERLEREMSAEDEIALLQRENEMSIEELRAKYMQMSEEEEDSVAEGDERSEEMDPFSIDDQAEADEFKPSAGAAVDDETTIEQEESLGREMSYEDEIDLLRKENEMSVEELRALYYNQHESGEDEGTSDSQDEAGYQSLAGADVDNETNIEAEERLGREMKYEEEINDAMSENDEEEELTSLRKPLDQQNEFGSKKRKTAPENYGEDEEDAGAAAIRSLEYADSKARNTAVSRPYLLAPWVKLREYQHVGLNWLVSIQTRRLNGILADEMGLGKTLQTISLFSYLASYKGIWGPHLIVVPTSCIVNWEVELKRFCPALKILCYYGSAKRRKELRQGWTKTNWHHVVITSYQLVVQDSFAFKRKKWYYLVLDEAHNIKNFQSQRWQTLVNFNTQRRLLLTGTPLQNNLMELWSLLHFLMPHVFRSRKEFSYWFSNPMNNIIEGNSTKNDDLISRLHGIIRPFVLRRLKKDVEKQMPGKYEHIVKCHLSRRQMFLYEEFMARSSTRMALQKGGNYMGMMNVLMQLRKVCNHPDLFEARSIITPFCTERIAMVTAKATVDILHSDNPLQQISSRLLHPVWSVSSGEPSCEEVIKQDKYVTERRRKLQIDPHTLKNRPVDESIEEPLLVGGEDNPGLARLLKNTWTKSKLERQRNNRFQATLNADRCDGQSFLFPASSQKAATVDLFSLDSSPIQDLTHEEIAFTPSHLLQLRRSQELEREREAEELQKDFVFYVPKAGSQKPLLFPKSRTVVDERSLSQAVNKVLPTQHSGGLFFPDKKLVQFDAGKLQILSELLRNLKQGKHRVLIFTQMSKMLDILETFLNLNGHTYLRLDGGTSVDQRQRLMDRFNNDEKVFCFILSTRSGGLGINLTGADTVVFYDSDWNPAMDAQAQDRAHRIGQTRDVHIYRLVTEHSIEENILVKAKQKRHLDFLVMDEGKFHAAPKSETGTVEDEENGGDESSAEFDISSKSGLRNILGVMPETDSEIQPDKDVANENNSSEVSKEQIESAMTTFEDEDDVQAMRGAQQEAKEELQEFDEDIRINKDDEEGAESQESQDENAPPGKDKQKPEAPKNETKEEGETAALEKEFAAWQIQVGVDQASIDASLNPVERYALRFKEDIEPFYSMWYLSEQQRIQDIETDQEEWDIEEIEAMKAEEEQNAIEAGDLLATLPEPEELLRQQRLYHREKARLVSNKKRHRLTGENWTNKIDGKTNLPFWYNCDTGEAIWHKPKILLELEEYELAAKRYWNAVPLKPLVRIMEYLTPFPERMTCAITCKQWRQAAQDISFVRHVYPVEMGALTMDLKKMSPYHYKTISEALAESLPGDTIELGDGHYWINEPNLVIDFPLRIIGDEKNPSHVVIELSGTITWRRSVGFMEGITFRRPRIGDINMTKEMLKIDSGNLVFVHGVLEGAKTKPTEGFKEPAGSCGAMVRGNLKMEDCVITKIQGSGIDCFYNSGIELVQTRIVSNSGSAVRLNDNSTLTVVDCDMRENAGGEIEDNRATHTIN